jgi:uncharacterized membrane protein YgcG
MRKAPVKMLAVAAAVLLAGCGSHRLGPEGGPDGPGGPGGRHEEEWHPPVGMLLRYDANHDGSVTRSEMEAGLKVDFAADDTNHDGVLDPVEVRAVNERRWNEDASATSPLVDWNHDGVVDFNEFAATARSLFDQMDIDGNGVLSPAELKPKGSRQGPGQGDKGDGQQGGHGGPGGGQGGGGQGGGGRPPGR